MMPIQYMSPDGVWLESCQEGTPCSYPGAVLAPADEDGYYGAEGLCWNGSAWVKYFAPPEKCTRLQGLLALGMERANQVEQLVMHLDLIMPELGPEKIFEMQTAYRNAVEWYRLHPFVGMIMGMFDMTEAERDDLMRLAVTL